MQWLFTVVSQYIENQSVWEFTKSDAFNSYRDSQKHPFEQTTFLLKHDCLIDLLSVKISLFLRLGFFPYHRKPFCLNLNFFWSRWKIFGTHYVNYWCRTLVPLVSKCLHVLQIFHLRLSQSSLAWWPVNKFCEQNCSIWNEP